MTEPEVFVLADRALNTVVAQVRDDQWTMEMPANFLRRGGGDAPTLREIINYHAYDDSWVPAMLAGKTMDEVGKDEFKGDLLGDDPRGSFAAIVEKACAAAQDLTDLDRIVHCSFGDYSARDYLVQTHYFRGVRANDIAKVIGADPTLAADLVQALWNELRPIADEMRSIGVFDTEVIVADDAPLQDRLLGLTGRNPYA